MTISLNREQKIAENNRMLRKQLPIGPKEGRLAAVSSRPAPASTVLLTGFSPFDGASINVSWQLAESLNGDVIEGHTVVAAQLPTEFDTSRERLGNLMQQHMPALVICLGQAGGRDAISLERIAINVTDARIADNAGVQPVDKPVVSGGPPAYFTGLPIKAILQTLLQAGIAAEVSQTAGTYVCNHVFYGLMHDLDRRRLLTGMRGGFIHVPLLPEQGSPSMTLADMQQGLRLAIGCALTTRQDVKIGAGAEH
jgi:pyroglutamyl-peptidase